MNIEYSKSSLDNGKDSVGSDSKSSKRNSGLFSFFKWLKPTGSASRESLNSTKTDKSSSCESLNSVQSSRTVASFSYVDPSEYSNNLTNKNIFQSPETDTYKARIKQRDHRREKDKDLTLRKKYNLFFNRDTTPNNDITSKENTKSLPLMTNPNSKAGYEEEGFHRRTNSDSSKVKKAGSYLHVKGKRKAPQPPNINECNSTATLKKTNKRLAPPPPRLNSDTTIFSMRQEREVFSTSSFDPTQESSYKIENEKSLPQMQVLEIGEHTLTGKENMEDIEQITENNSEIVQQERMSDNSFNNKEISSPRSEGNNIRDSPENRYFKVGYAIAEKNVNNSHLTNKPTHSPNSFLESAGSSDILSNDSLKLDHGILKSVKEEEQNIYSECSPFNSKNPADASKPWYKRQESTAHLKREFFRTSNESKYDPIESLPEVSFNRNTTQCPSSNILKDTKKEENIEKKRDDKRKSGVSLLPNISELDREAAEILQKEKLKRIDDFNEMPEFMKTKVETNKTNTDSWTSPKKRSARDLIAKFNAITNVTKATVNTAFFGSTQKKEYFGKSSSKELKKKQETLLESHRKRLDMIDNKINTEKNTTLSPLMKTESASAIKKPGTPKNERNSWNCPKCYVENEYWRIICYVCSSIKPYFDDLSESPNYRKSDKSHTKDIKNKNQNEHFLERSKTQIGFSALSSMNVGKKINREIYASSSSEISKNIQDKKEEREKLKKMLIEMKNSLPKKNIRTRIPNSHKLATEKIKLNVKNMQTVLSIDTESSDTDNEHIGNTSAETSGELNAEEKKEEKNEGLSSVLVVTEETVHEQIEVKKSSDPKPIKVSSSVQTSSIMSKLPEPSEKVNVTAMLKKKNSFEPMKVQDFEDIYGDQGGNSVSRIYANLAQDDELRLFFNIPKDLTEVKNTMSKIKLQNENRDTIQISRLLRKLEVAIAKGELNQAADYAKELAQLRVSCSVVRQNANSERNKTDQTTFSVDMYVEDKISHRGPFPIQVRPERTVGELKKLVEEEFQIPANVQRWILGKELATDDNSTLQENNITDGCPIFLYLVAPDSTSNENQGNLQNSDQPSTSTRNLEKHVDEQKFDKYYREEKLHQPWSNPEMNNSKLEVSAEISGPFEKTNGPKIINAIPKESDSNHQNGASPDGKSIISQNMKKIQVDSSDINKKLHSFNEVVTQTVTTALFMPDSQQRPHDSEEDDVKTLKPTRLSKEWECHLCTLLNPMNNNICGVCATVRKIPPKKVDNEDFDPQTIAPHQFSSGGQTYLQLMNLDNADIVHNTEPFECIICFTEVRPNQGVTLRECLHQFCKECVRHTIEFSEEAEIRCPYRDDQYSCNIALQDREIKALVSKTLYDQHLAKSVAQAENRIDKSFHCKTPDCGGWCIFEDNVNEFRCPVCSRINCLTCQAIHMGVNCKQYQQRMTEESENDENAKQTLQMLDKMVKNGEALKCPTCNVIMMKKWGCDWLRCSMCKTEICWVTKGPRWGPRGKGDVSGGCQCGVNGVKCHPKCNYCH